MAPHGRGTAAAPRADVAPKMIAIGAPDVRAALAAAGGDLRAVGARFALSSEQLLMILAYDITVTTTTRKERSAATGVFAAIDNRETQPPPPSSSDD